MLIALLSGCAVGPDFVRPTPPAVTIYGETAPPEALTGGEDEATQRLVVGGEIAAAWWDVFQSPLLVQTVRDAIAGNQTLAVAEATLAQAQEGVADARAAFFPQIAASADATRQRTRSSGTHGASGSTFNLFSLGPTVSFSPDVFGGTRRHVEQEAALAESQRYQLSAAHLTLTGNVVSQAITIAGTRLQIAAVEEIAAEDERNLELVRIKFDVGKSAQSDVLSAETQLANDRAQLPPLRQQLSAARHALSVLVGRFPAAWSPPDFDLAQLALPADLPVTLPSALVRKRPDILAAEAELHAASAAIGVATAAMYPSITLSASLGQAAMTPSAVFAGANTAWSIASDVAAPIFEGGALTAQRRAAVDVFRATLATYQQTVLQAFAQVADVLDALAHDADLVADERRALDDATASLTLQQLSYREGKSDLLQLLDSQRLLQQARLGYVHAQTQRFQDTTQLFVAMGGGWWEPAADPET